MGLPVAVRMALVTHAKALFLVFAALLSVALTIDFAESYDSIAEVASDTDRPLASVLVQHAGFRIVDMVTRQMPVAVLIAAFLAEIVRRSRLETVGLAAGTIGVRPTFIALLLLALPLGVLQVSLESVLRPWAVFSQVALGTGSYAERFEPRRFDAPEWFFHDDQLLRAFIVSGPAPELDDVRAFRGLSPDGIEQVILSPAANPGATSGTWALDMPEVWQSDGVALSLLPEGDTPTDADLSVPAERIAYHGMAAFYLPNDALQTLNAFAPDGDLGTAIWRRYAALFLPGAMMLLGASLALVGFAGRHTRPATLAIAAVAGYAPTVAIKAFYALGEFEILHPMVAVFAPLIFIFAASTVLLLSMRTVSRVHF